jgi:hypothetical protein
MCLAAALALTLSASSAVTARGSVDPQGSLAGIRTFAVVVAAPDDILSQAGTSQEKIKDQVVAALRRSSIQILDAPLSGKVSGHAVLMFGVRIDGGPAQGTPTMMIWIEANVFQPVILEWGPRAGASTWLYGAAALAKMGESPSPIFRELLDSIVDHFVAQYTEARTARLSSQKTRDGK